MPADLRRIGADPVAFSPDGRFALSGGRDTPPAVGRGHGANACAPSRGIQQRIDVCGVFARRPFRPFGERGAIFDRRRRASVVGRDHWDVPAYLRGEVQGPWRFHPTAATPSPGARQDAPAVGRGHGAMPAHLRGGTDKQSTSVAFSPNGRYALSGGWDGNAPPVGRGRRAMPAHLRGL